jgi:hypothetical protein
VSKPNFLTPVLSILFVLAALACPAPLAAATPSKKVHGVALSGRVSKVDAASKTLSVRDSSGREVALAWTGATKMTGGELKVGEVVTVRYLDKDKKHIATTIHVGPSTTQTAKAAPPAVSPSPATK